MSDDFDDRFRDIVESDLAELDTEPVEIEPFPDPEPSPPPAVRSVQLTSPRSWTPPPEPDDFTPPPPLPPARHPSAVAWAGIAAVVGGACVVVASLLGWLAPTWGAAVGVGAICVGILVLFTRLPRDRDRGPDNGAVV